jgi:hypothetical protein
MGLNEDPGPQCDLMADLLHVDMFKVISDMLWSEDLRIQEGKSAKFGYLPMMTVTTLGVLNSSVGVSCLVSSLLCLTYT